MEAALTSGPEEVEGRLMGAEASKAVTEEGHAPLGWRMPRRGDFRRMMQQETRWRWRTPLSSRGWRLTGRRPRWLCLQDRLGSGARIGRACSEDVATWVGGWVCPGRGGGAVRRAGGD